ncbi:MAG: F0F1 ATP synthase subunit A [Dermatophilaceae bacterium]
MSLYAWTPDLVTGAGAVVAEGGGEGSSGTSFVSPGTSDFYWPLIGGDNNWAFTRPAAFLLISVIVLGFFYLTVSRRLQLVPGRTQWMAEGAYGFVRNTIGRDIIGAKDFRVFLPLLFTLFTMILLNNLFGVIPFIQYPTMSRVGFPIVLTLIVYVVYHTTALRRKHGLVGYMKSLIPAGLPGWLKPILFVLEFLTYFVIRPLTLALRLFGNMLAGHLMLLVFIVGGEYLLLHGDSIVLKGSGVLSFAFAVFMTFFEILIEFLQAFIFTLLAALYIGDAVSEHH